MNFKKRFNKRIEEDKRSMLTESDMAYLATLQSMVVERPEGEVIAKPLNYKKPLLISVACFLAVALALSLVLYFTLTKQKGIFYQDDNFREVVSSVEMLNSDLLDFSLVVDENKYSADVQKVYDSVSGDTIYYKLTLNDGQRLSVQFEIVVNKNYTHSEMLYGWELFESAVSGNRLIYTQNITSSSVAGIAVNTVVCTGEIKIGNQWVYIIGYQEISLGEGTFVDFMQSIIQIK